MEFFKFHNINPILVLANKFVVKFWAIFIYDIWIM